MEPVKVTFVSSHAQLGGSEKLLENTLEALGPEWINDVVSLQRGPAVARWERHHPVHVLHTGAGKMELLRAALKLRARLRTRPPQVVHANGVKAALTCAIATAFTGWPVAWFKHDTTFDGIVARQIARRCEITVGASSAVLEAVEGSGKTQVIYPGVTIQPGDPAAARRELAESHQIEPHTKIVTLVGRLHPSKGQSELIAVADRLRAGRPDLTFLLAGGEDPGHPGYRDVLKEQVRSSGLEGSVHLLGYLQDVADLIAASDVLVVPSIVGARGTGKEGFGLVVVEAMLAGTPVVAYAQGALPEIMGDTGLLVEPGNREALAEAIVQAIDSGDRERTEAAIKRASAFSPETNALATKKLYVALAR